ncbi:MAG: YggS family pyridoxal phosphate-dependent enzyme [Lachnospiraceae bacterium]|nr:YggS family pyridoxal phosphate-dependent enzyme [Lachnospiraceae bacterium]
MIRENLKTVEENIVKACERSGRKREDVTLIAVSKTKPVEDIMEAYEAGIRDFGENKVQELCDKYEALPKDIRWHMIGHLQKNKVKYLIGKTVLIHGVDSFELASEINKRSEQKNTVTDILIEVNIANEETKFGIRPESAFQLVERIMELSYVNVKGLMCIAPYVVVSEQNREFFKKMLKLDVDIINKLSNNTSMDVMSMGMTCDYETAIEEGATMVRVGTGIFGERDYGAKT